MKQKIKICFVANNANHSGAARSLWQIVKYLNRNRFEFIVIINKVGSGLSKITPYAKCYTFKIKHYRFRYTYKIRRVISILFEKKWFIQKLKKFNPDIIYFNTNAAVNYMKWAKEAATQAKIVCHIHGQNEGLTYYMMMPEGNIPINKEWLNITKQVPDYFIACACASKEVLTNELNIPDSKIIVAHESIDVEEIKGHKKNISKEELGWNDKYVVGVVATLGYRKGIDIFIEAVHAIQHQYQSKYPNLLFVWLGSDGTNSSGKEGVSEYTKYCQEKIKEKNLTEKLLLMGHRADIYTYMKNLDVFVLPTRDECLPLSILEAMVLKIPVVATAVSGIPEVINSTNGILVEPNPQSLLNGILKALAYIEKKDYRMVEKASQDVLAFDVKKQMLKIEETLENIFID